MKDGKKDKTAKNTGKTGGPNGSAQDRDPVCGRRVSRLGWGRPTLLNDLLAFPPT